MSMPPPINKDDDDAPPDTPGVVGIPRIDLRAIARKLGECDAGNLLFSLGAGIIAFNEARKFRKNQEKQGEWYE